MSPWAVLSSSPLMIVLSLLSVSSVSFSLPGAVDKAEVSMKTQIEERRSFVYLDVMCIVDFAAL